MKAMERLVHLLQALQHGIVLRTREERRGIETILSAVNALDTDRAVYTWSAASGLKQIIDYPKEPKTINENAEVRDAFVFAAKQETPIVLIMLDAQNGFEGQAKRYCREALVACRKIGSSLVFVGNDYKLPPEFSSDVWVLDLPIPDLDEIIDYVKSVAVRYENMNESHKEEKDYIKVKIDAKCFVPFARACQGLTMGEVQSILSLAVVEFGGITKECVKIALSEKTQIVRREGLVEIEEPAHSIDDVGGLKILKAWAKERFGLYSEDAAKAGIAPPKGVLVAGIAGTGKTYLARALAALFQVPLLRVDVGKLFGQYVGESEANVRRVIQIIDGCGFCVVLLDEIDKGMGQDNGGGDSGTSRRVLATFLTWMQDKRSPSFVVGTLNHIEYLDPAFIRKGRFDEIFYCDLPNTQAREEIFKIHLDGKLGEVKPADLPKLAKATDGYVGAEIASIVQSARISAYARKVSLSTEIVLAKIKETVPLSLTMKEQIDSMRQMVKSGRVRLADEIEQANNWLAGDVLPPLPMTKKGK